MREVENLNPQRERRPPQRFDDELYNCTEDLTADINEPSNINEAWTGKNSTEWKKATESEYKSLIDNHTWELVPPPHDKNIVGSKWLFKVKKNATSQARVFTYARRCDKDPGSGWSRDSPKSGVFLISDLYFIGEGW